MQLADVNVLVHALREDSPQHAPCRTWLQAVVDGDEAFGVADLVLSGCVRVATHPRVFRTPTPLDVAVAFVDAVRGQPHAVPVAPGPRHWGLFTRLAHEAGAKGNLIPDAYLAALAIESGSEWVTTDRDFSRFPSLRWRDPTA